MTLSEVLSSKEMINTEKILLIFFNEVVDENNKVNIKLADISKYTNMSRPAVLRAINKLVELNLIEVKKNFASNGVYLTNTYILLGGKIKK